MPVTIVLIAAGLVVGSVLLARVRIPTGTAAATTVSVVIPARNEEASLPALLGSLAEQTLTPLEIVVVDDSSTDGTAAVASSWGATLIRATVPPEGWIGKPWACHVGAQVAEGEVLVFLDADVVVAPDGLDRIVASWQREAPEGLLSVQPFHVTKRAYEQVSAFPNLMSMMASGAFAPWRWRSSPVAFGPCLVTSQAAYRAVGGHETVAGEVIEDLCLARAYRSAERAVRALAGGPVVSFRMYPRGFRQLVDGWTKNLAGGPRFVGVVPLVGSTAWILATIGVASNLVQALATAAMTGEVRWAAIAASVLVAAQIHVLLRRIGSFRWWAAAAFPLLAASFVALFARSVIHRTVFGSVTWRDRSVPVHAR